MVDMAEMLEAHVRFELQRFSAEGFAAAVAEEVAALFDWLGTVPLEQLLAPDLVEDWIQTYLRAEITSVPRRWLTPAAVRAAAAARRRRLWSCSRARYDQFASR
jgi:hypothetical protein